MQSKDFIEASMHIKSFVSYTCCITLKLVYEFVSPISRCHCALETQLFLKKCSNGGEPLATLCLIKLARGLNLRPPIPEKNVLQLEQLAGQCKYLFILVQKYYYWVTIDLYCSSQYMHKIPQISEWRQKKVFIAKFHKFWGGDQEKKRFL